MVRVWPGMLPPTISTTPNSPSVCTKVSTIADSTPGQASGSSTRQKVDQKPSPLTAAASQGQDIKLFWISADIADAEALVVRNGSSVNTLADLKGKDLSFGSQSSTSGHLMPRSFLMQAGLNPDKDLRRVAFSGAHDATIAAVASGKVQAGALNISVWDKFIADKKVDTAKVRAFYTTPPYYDYNWTVHADMPAALREKLKQALLALSKDSAEGRQILELQRATRFVPTQADNYKGIEAAARSAGLL